MIYQYVCESCEESWEVVKPLSQIDRNEPCPKCSSVKTHRVISAPGFTTSESLGRRKAPAEFRDLLKTIHKSTPGSKIQVD